MDDVRAVLREELAHHEEKPKKLPIQERVTQLEGLILRLMEEMGKVKPDPNLIQPSAAGQATNSGMAPDAMPSLTDMPGQAPEAPAAPPSGMPPGGGAPQAQPQTQKMAHLTQDPLVQSVRLQFLLGLQDMREQMGYQKRAEQTEVLEQPAGGVHPLSTIGKPAPEALGAVTQPLNMDCQEPPNEARQQKLATARSGLSRAASRLRR
jgi:hypothetical protein